MRHFLFAVAGLLGCFWPSVTVHALKADAGGVAITLVTPSGYCVLDPATNTDARNLESNMQAVTLGVGQLLATFKPCTEDHSSGMIAIAFLKGEDSPAETSVAEMCSEMRKAVGTNISGIEDELDYVNKQLQETTPGTAVEGAKILHVTDKNGACYIFIKAQLKTKDDSATPIAIMGYVPIKNRLLIITHGYRKSEVSADDFSAFQEIVKALQTANLGLFYENGQGVAQDYAKAREWYEKAAAKDDAQAMATLGWLYANGQGVAQDYAKAREWYEKAAAKDDAQAMATLGWLYANGQGVAQDYAKAREWYEKAAAKDNAQAMATLGWVYANGQGVAQDYAKAREWYEKAAAKDDAQAMATLGWLYANGQGVAQDYAKALEWYERAAAKDNAQAMATLGWLYANGQGVAQDYAKAREWYEKAAAKDDAQAMATLGWLYANGQGVAQDYAKAREWYERAAAKDNAQAMATLGWLYANGQGMAQDYAKAREWYEKAAAKTADASVKASALENLSYYSLFVRDFAGALSASEETITLLPKDLTPITNKAHALMFLGRAKEAQELYLKYKGQRFTDMGLWEEEILKDFDKLEKAGVTHPQMAEIRAALGPR